MSNTSTAAIDQFLQQAVDRKQVPGMVALVADQSRVRYRGTFGSLDSGAGTGVSQDAIFRVMSMTKPVTSVMVLALQELGELDLDDAISRYLPEYKDPAVIEGFDASTGRLTTQPARREITIRDLLTHTAGFGYAFSHPLVRDLEAKGIREVDQLPLLHEPGLRWTYGPSTRILGNLLARITGQSLEDLYQGRIFGPLRMPDTSYLLPAEKHRRTVTCWLRRGRSLAEQPRPESYESVPRGDGGLFSTAPDYLRFLQMLLNRGTLDGVQILRPETVDLMVQNQIGDLVVEWQSGAIAALSQAFPLGAGQDKFGLGFQIAASPRDGEYRRSEGSYSWGGLYNTHFWVDPVRELAVVFLTQMLPFYDPGCISVLQGFEELVYQHLG